MKEWDPETLASAYGPNQQRAPLGVTWNVKDASGRTGASAEFVKAKEARKERVRARAIAKADARKGRMAHRDAMQRTGHGDLRMLSHYSHGRFSEIFEDRFSFMQVPEGEGSEA